MRRATKIRAGALLTAIVLVAVGCRPVPGDFDHDGRSELWYSKGGGPGDEHWYAYGAPDTPVAPVTGFPVTGDFDGDGHYEPASGLWAAPSTNPTSPNNWYSATRGWFSFPPPPFVDPRPPARQPFEPHYDVDDAHLVMVPLRWKGTTTKAAWFRDSDATWWIEGEPSPIQFGDGIDVGAGEPGMYAQDIPVPGDYDGDGQDELAVYHPLSRSFEIQGEPAPIQIGQAAGLPLAVDLDGDGRDEPAVYLGGKFLVSGPSDGPSVVAPPWDMGQVFFTPGDLGEFPVIGDFSAAPGLEAAGWQRPSTLRHAGEGGVVTVVDFEPGDAFLTPYGLSLQAAIYQDPRIRYINASCMTWGSTYEWHC